jgi:negative regulator of sigma E activity
MNEQEHSSQLSALFDGQLPPQQAEMVIRRALREPAMRASWERYALIGARLRAEPIAGPLSVADRVQASIAAERELNILPLPARTAVRCHAVPVEGMVPDLSRVVEYVAFAVAHEIFER